MPQKRIIDDLVMVQVQHHQERNLMIAPGPPELLLETLV
jgi:hypothetical protein